jgi:CheY-like chemotaxis protein
MEILVADDEPAVAVAIKAALKFYGHTVLTVSNGDAALEHVRAEPGRFSAVMSDHNMPGLGGLGLVKALRDAGYAGRVIILSAFLNPDIEAKYKALGVNQILAKPFHIEKLRLALDSSA